MSGLLLLAGEFAWKAFSYNDFQLPREAWGWASSASA